MQQLTQHSTAAEKQKGPRKWTGRRELAAKDDPPEASNGTHVQVISTAGEF